LFGFCDVDQLISRREEPPIETLELATGLFIG